MDCEVRMSIGNQYGGLVVKEEGGKFFWRVDGFGSDEWEEIPETLYRACVTFETGSPDPNNN